MATYVNKLVVQDAGQIKKVGAGDDVQIGGGFTAGSFTGSGSGLTSIPQSGVTNLTSDLSTLTSSVGTAQADATQALSDAAAAQTTANNAATAASNAQTDATNAATAASNAQMAADNAATAASNAQTAADNAATAASNAQSTANSAASDASSAKAATDAATDQNTAGTIVKRDSSGNFSAGTITADLTGTASQANQWSSSRSVTFAGGDVTGSFSIDGSGDVGSVGLSIGTSTVTDAMLAGSISDSKLSQITTANKVADTALSANIPKLDAATNAFTGSMSIQGSLNVTGPIVSNGEMNVIVHDAFLDLSAGNVGTVAKASGLSFNLKKATGFTAETASAFVAGVLSTSAPTMAMTATTALAAGDIVEVHGTVGGTNDGLYVVASVSGTGASTVVTIKGIGGTLPSANVPFANNQFTASTGETASVIKVDLAVFAVSGGALTASGAAAIPAGTFCYNYQAGATESSFADSWTSLNSVATPTLQDVYGAGTNGIVLTTGRNLLVQKPTSGTAAISLEANAASTIDIVGAQLDIKTSGSAADVVLTASKSVVVASPLMLPTGDGSTVVSSGVGFIQSVAAGVSEGDLLYIDTDGVAKKASNSGRKAQVVALESNGGGTAADKRVTSVRGAKVYITVTGGAAAGDTLYLSSTAGQATKTAPTTNLLQSVGEVIGAAIGSHYPVIFEPRVIVDDLGA